MSGPADAALPGSPRDSGAAGGRFRPVVQLDVFYRDDGRPRPVGRLAIDTRGRTFFEYDAAWARAGLPLAPLLLPIGAEASRLAVPGPEPRQRHGRWHGVHPLFADSLPDQWGLGLMDGAFLDRGISPQDVSDLDRLAYLGDATMGALTYRPALDDGAGASARGSGALDALAAAAEEVVSARRAGGSPVATPGALATLRRAAGGSGGAEAKALLALTADDRVAAVGADGAATGATPVLVKFTSRYGDVNAGAVEHAYALMARAAGLRVPDTRLVATDDGVRHFAVARFDRTPDGGRRHVQTYGSLAGVAMDADALDYDGLLRAARAASGDARCVAEAVQRMCFNLAAGNDDDHPKNTSFLMGPDGAWALSPAYDLTLTPQYGGARCMAVLGRERAVSWARAEALAARHGVAPRAFAATREAVEAAVADWPVYADEAGVPVGRAAEVAAALRARRAEMHAVDADDRRLLRRGPRQGGARERDREAGPGTPT